MTDFDKLIKSLERCASGGKCNGCYCHDECEGTTNAAMIKARDLLREQRKTINELEARKAEWISANDRPPEKAGDYLVSTKSGFVWTYFFRPSIGWYDSSGYLADDVTHWMPLPEPPMEEGESDAGS